MTTSLEREMNTIKLNRVNQYFLFEGTFANQGFLASYEVNDAHKKGVWTLIEVNDESLNVNQNEWEEAFYEWIKFRIDPNNGNFIAKSSMECFVCEEVKELA